MSSRHTQDENRPTLKTPRLRAGGWSQGTPAATPSTMGKASLGKTPGRTPGMASSNAGNEKDKETSKTPVRGLRTPTAKSASTMTKSTSTATATSGSMTTSTSTSTSTSASTTAPASTKPTARTPLRTPLRPRTRVQQENPFAPTRDDGAKGKGKRAADDAGPASKRRALSAVGENTPVPNKSDEGKGTARKRTRVGLTPSTSTSATATATATATTPRISTTTKSTRRTPTSAASTSTATATAKPKPKPARRPALTRASTADILARPLGPEAYTTPAPGRRRKPPVSGLTGLLRASSRRINVRPDPEAFEDVVAARGIDVDEIEGCAGGVVDPPYDPPTPPRGREEEALYAVLEEPEIDLPDLPPSPHLDLPDLPDLDFVL